MSSSSRPRGALVSFSGVDCAGKSTQIGLLKANLERGRVPHSVFWYRPGYSKELDALRRTIRRLRPGAIPAPKDNQARDAAFAKPGVTGAWVAVALADLLLQYGVKVRVAKLAGRTVVCDRYVQDAHIDLNLRFPALRGRLSMVFRLVEALCPKPDVSVLLTLPEEELNRRVAAKHEPFPDPDEVRAQRYKAYQSLRGRPGLLVLDSTASIEEVAARIKRCVEESGCT